MHLPEDNILISKIDFKQYLEILLNRKDVFIISVLVCLIVGTGFVLATKPTYRASAQLQVNTGVNMPIASSVYRDRPEDYYYLSNQIELLQGKTLKDNVLSALSSWVDKVPKKFLEPKLKVETARGNVISILADSPYKEYALAYVETLMKEYMTFKTGQKEKSSSFALSNLTKQASQLNDKITGMQKEILKFKEQHNDILLDDYGNFSNSYLMTLTRKQSEIRSEMILIEKKIQALEGSEDPSFWISVIDDIQRGTVTPTISKEAQPEATLSSMPSTNSKFYGQGKTGTPSQSVNSIQVEQLPFVFILEKEQSKYWQDLKVRYGKLKSEYARIAKLYKPEHPYLKQVSDDLSTVKRDMASEVGSLLEKFKAKYEGLKLEEQAVDEELKRWQSTSLTSSSVVNQFSALKDEELRLKKLYQALVDRIEEISVTSDFGLETVQIVQNPRVDRLPFKKLFNLLMVIVVSFMGGCGVVFAVEYLDDSIKSSDDLRKYTGLAALGMVNAIDWNQGDVAGHKITFLKDSHVVEAYRSIRTNILLAKPESVLKTILITSAVPSEGKTTSSVNTAIVLAQSGLKVLLIDADMRRPTIHKVFSLKDKNGLSAVLAETESFDSCVQKTDVENLDLLPAGHIVSDPPKLLHASKIKELFQALCKRYDRIIIDSAPVLTVTDSVILSDLVDGIIFVVYGGKTSRLALIRAKEVLLTNSTKIFGTIINNLSIKKMSGYYYSYYGYKYKYHYGYGKENSSSKKEDKKTEEVIL
ncbi:MAG: polysaccharide biosynthesis tyrosine autokinase [Candidatus Omnitrophota bacterium]